MNRTRKKFSNGLSMDRRTFLKGAATVVGASLLGVVGCDSDPSEEGTFERRDDTTLFTPASIGNVQLKNRIIRSATEEAYCESGCPSPRFTKVFTDLAAGGVGAIISGIAMVAEEESLPFELYAFNDSYIDGYVEVRKAVRDVDPDCKIFAQVGHQGYRYFNTKEFGTRIGPSDVSWPGDQFPMRAMEVEEIEQVVDLFAHAIRRFKEGGWDGVEIHGGHGYLISTFLSPYSNKRTDRYGGSVAGRVQIVKEIVEQARALVGDDFPIFIKFNSDDGGGSGTQDLVGGIDKEIFVETANELAKMKIDAIDVTGNNCSRAGVNDIEEQSYFKDAAVALELDIPVILTGGNRTPDALNEILDTGEIDFIGISRPLIREPDLANKWLSGVTDGADCVSCNQCAQMDNLMSGMKCHLLG